MGHFSFSRCNPHYLDRRSRYRSPPSDCDRLADRESNSVANTFPIAVACRDSQQHMVRHTLFWWRSLVVVHTNLFAITYLIADQDLDHLLERDLFAYRDGLADRGLLLDRLIANVIFPIPITPSP